METQKQCAYNQTRGSFLGFEVDAADFTSALLDDRMTELTPRSGAGLWMVPFRGIPETSVHEPLDLVYLDQNCAVIGAVESFPIFHLSPSCPPAASVLALPNHMIVSTHTQPGDQLLVCAPEEMRQRLLTTPWPGAAAVTVRSPALWNEEPMLSREAMPAAAPALPQWDDSSRRKRPIEYVTYPDLPGIDLPDQDLPESDLPHSQQPLSASSMDHGTSKTMAPKRWFERWRSSDPAEPRKAPRESLPGLSAYFWTGGLPQKHAIRDISSTGLFVVTEERWFPGTVVRMTLTDCAQPTPERSICLHATAVRWGNDGVGLQFVLKQTGHLRSGHMPLVEGIEKNQLRHFMQLLGSACA